MLSVVVVGGWLVGGVGAGCPHNKFLHAIVCNANTQAFLHGCHTAPPVVLDAVQHSASAHLFAELLCKRYCYLQQLLRMRTHKQTRLAVVDSLSA